MSMTKGMDCYKKNYLNITMVFFMEILIFSLKKTLI